MRGTPGADTAATGTGAPIGTATFTGTVTGSLLRAPSTATGANACTTGPTPAVLVSATARTPHTPPTSTPTAPSTPTATSAITARTRYPGAFTTGSTARTGLGDKAPPAAGAPHRATGPPGHRATGPPGRSLAHPSGQRTAYKALMITKLPTKPTTIHPHRLRLTSIATIPHATATKMLPTRMATAPPPVGTTLPPATLPITVVSYQPPPSSPPPQPPPPS